MSRRRSGCTVTSGEIADGQWSPLDGFTAGNQRRAIDPCGEVCRGECRCEDDGDGAMESSPPVMLPDDLPDLPQPAGAGRPAWSAKVRR
jgi:hypothetical protein